MYTRKGIGFGGVFHLLVTQMGIDFGCAEVLVSEVVLEHANTDAAKLLHQ